MAAAHSCGYNKGHCLSPGAKHLHKVVPSALALCCLILIIELYLGVFWLASSPLTAQAGGLHVEVASSSSPQLKTNKQKLMLLP